MNCAVRSTNSGDGDGEDEKEEAKRAVSEIDRFEKQFQLDDDDD